MDDLTLLALRPGQQARICALELGGGMRRRLRDMGMIEGALVSCLGVSPGGDPKAYLLRGTALALRAVDSGRIRVELI